MSSAALCRSGETFAVRSLRIKARDPRPRHDQARHRVQKHVGQDAQRNIGLARRPPAPVWNCAA